MASGGLFTISRTQSGEWRAISLTFCSTIFWFVNSRSSRLIPACAARRRVKTTASSRRCRSPGARVPRDGASKPTMGPASARSRALPWASPSTTSTITMSA